MPEWLTWAQAGARFGISADAARMRANRLGWRTQPGNDGRTLVAVPDDADVKPRHRSPEVQPEHPPEVRPEQPERAAELARLSALLDAALGSIERAEAAADKADRRADQAMIRADAADADRRTAEARADAERQGREAERTRADTAEAVAADLRTRLAQAEAIAAAMVQAETERAAEPLVRRMWWALAGR